ncbi:ribonuclease H protein [Pyrus ussuriensis x Pyrus communis]|uniref:Ribonuclease H protein n=1 Tax=Pyrus ussuriensis x Pyrus communis TaxID=2448454 RepID=A0A5N5GM30_9ROSA|nr:ribonuclease H protein [Pyrus ussuriensis x Pyrus communis]
MLSYKLVWRSVWRKEGIGSALHAELVAVLEGLRLARRLEARHVLVESGSTPSLAVINNHSKDLSEFNLVCWRKMLGNPETCKSSSEHDLA